MRKRNVLTEKSKCVFSDDLDVSKSLTPAALAKIAGIDRSGVTRAINNGSLNSIGGKISLSDLKNTIWLIKRLQSEITVMDSDQRDQASRLLKELESLPATTAPAPAAPAPTTKTAKTPAPTPPRPEPYSPDALQCDKYYSIGTLTRDKRLRVLVEVYTGKKNENILGWDIDIPGGTDFEFSLTLDNRGRLAAIAINDKIQNLFFI
jgi:hypothetical protein